MKDGRSLQELAAELTRQAEASVDVIANTSRMEMVTEGPVSRLIIKGREGDIEGVATPHCHGQLSTRLRIRKEYYDLMRNEAPSLFDTNVNYWFEHRPATRMVRTLDGNARAFLSNRYNRRDNAKLLSVVLETVTEVGGYKVASCEVTDTRAYLKLICPRIEGEVRKGDVVQAGMVITNSEVGLGRTTLRPLLYRLVCTNGAIMEDRKYSKAHLGRALVDDEEDEVGQGLFSAEALEAAEVAFWLEVRDAVRNMVTPEGFNSLLEDLQVAAGINIKPSRAADTVDMLGDKFSLTDAERLGVLANLMASEDFTAYGVGNAITRHSQIVENYDRATELEAIGGKVFTLPAGTWRGVALAA